MPYLPGDTSGPYGTLLFSGVYAGLLEIELCGTVVPQIPGELVQPRLRRPVPHGDGLSHCVLDDEFDGSSRGLLM